MSRDPNQLHVFRLADELVVETYRATRDFPSDERFGLRAQIRGAAVSAPTNIVEGCARHSIRDYRHFLSISLSSASEARYLLGLSGRLTLMAAQSADRLSARYGDLVRALQGLINALSVARTTPSGPTRKVSSGPC